ncbi:MAG: DnaA/Hda family protein [Pirellulales bacterium]
MPGPWPSADDASHAGPAGSTFAAPRLTPEQSFVLDDDQPLLAAVIEAACEDLESIPHPLLLCGPPGSGKSHLARGIGEIWMTRFGESSAVVMLGGTEFVKQFIQAGERDRLGDWQTRIRNARLLILDDLNQLSTNPRAINELRFTLDEQTANGGRAILTSRLTPELIAGMTPALAGRLQAGVTETLRAPARPYGPRCGNDSPWRGASRSTSRPCETYRKSKPTRSKFGCCWTNWPSATPAGDASTRNA